MYWEKMLKRKEIQQGKEKEQTESLHMNKNMVAAAGMFWSAVLQWQVLQADISRMEERAAVALCHAKVQTSSFKHSLHKADPAALKSSSVTNRTQACSLQERS